MSKARKEAAKKKSVAQKSTTRAKKLHSLEQTEREPGTTRKPNVPTGLGLTSANDTEYSDSAQALFERAAAAIEMATINSDYLAAIDLLRQAIRIDPNQADYFVNLAEAYAHTEQHDFGLAACEMALRIAPQHAVAAENRRHALKALGLPDTTVLL